MISLLVVNQIKMHIFFALSEGGAKVMSTTSTTVLLGIGVVFAGLVCIVIICKITSAFCNIGAKKEKVADSTGVQAATVPAPTVIENRQEIIAAVSAAIAEELGTDISAIRIHSFKKL